MESVEIERESDIANSANRDRDSTINDKILPLRLLGERIDSIKSRGLRIVHCHGVFDLVHPGHVRHLAAARREGDILVVTLTPDHLVNKGPGRPVFNEQLRAESIAALQDVDYVAINLWATATETIGIIKPDVYVKGNDYLNRDKDLTGKINEEESAVIDVGGRIHFTNDITFSSSTLLNNYLSVYPKEVDDYLKQFRLKYTADQIIHYIESLMDMTVMVVGEAILDEYVYGNALGKSAKEPILALKYESQETHVGGSVVIANHLADFCKKVELVTYLGEINSQEELIRKNLKANVKPTFVFKPDSPTIVKRRFVDTYKVTKLWELYEINDAPLYGDVEANLNNQIKGLMPECDVVIAADYGHGLISKQIVDLLCECSKFLAVNTQINAANHGYHTLSKYPRADYACVHEGEVRLDQRATTGELKPLVRRLSDKMKCKSVMVTQGHSGTMLFRKDEGFSHTPALAVKVVDRVGAGDSVLAVSSLCEAAGLPADVVGVVANLVGAQAVTIVGNSRAIDKIALYKAIEALMK
ncbi:MAG: cytidyltransferase [Elusimicrobia bacterium]|nr:MAG: cytidyltransferase [Elusimicrobiota bacterium]